MGASPTFWANCVRVLCYSYVLASSNDSDEPEWCAIDGILPHLVDVEKYTRLVRKSGREMHARLVEAESSIRHERNRYIQKDSTLSMGVCVELVSKNAVWPLVYVACVVFRALSFRACSRIPEFPLFPPIGGK